MIPKIIHSCWFGKGLKPELVERCMASWHACMPSISDGLCEGRWIYMEWTEANFDILSAPLYVRQAYAAKKFAFVSDYVRLWALEMYGGVYMDTDMEVIRSFDELPELRGKSEEVRAFVGFEESLAHLPGTCVMGCEAHCQWVKDMLATYDGAEFIKKREMRNQKTEFDLTTNVHRLGSRMVIGGLVPNGKEQYIEHWGLHVYDHHHFSPLTSTRVMRKTKDTFAIHHFAASWHEQKELLAKMQSSPIVCEIINALIQVRRWLRKVKKV